MALDPTTLPALQSMIIGWQNALVSDSVNPNPDYSVDGQQVSRTQWRESLLKNIKETNALINALSPYQIITKSVL